MATLNEKDVSPINPEASQIYCTYCGANLLDDSAFCSKCGNKVNLPKQNEDIPEGFDQTRIEDVAETSSAPAEETAISNKESAEEKVSTSEPESEMIPPKRKRKWIIFVIVGIVFVALIAIIAASLTGGNEILSVTASPDVIHARMTDDGTAYIPLMDGNYVTIDEAVEEATITKDRNHIIVLLQDGTLYVTSPTLEEKHSIADNCSTISSVKNDGFLYIDEDDNVFRVLLADYSSVKLGKDIAVTIAESSAAVLYATDDGDIFTMSSTSSEKQKVGTYSNTVELESISDNGQISVWVTEKNDVQTIILNDGEDKFTLGEVDYEYNYTYVTFSKDQNMAVVTNAYSDRMWIKNLDQDPIEVKLGTEPYSSTIYTNAGALENTLTADVSSLYIATEGDSGINVYNITLNGDRERVISKANDFVIANGNIIYLDKDDTLYCGKLSGSLIEEEIKITSDVDLFQVSQNGRYVYYLKDGNDTGSLYCYAVGADDSRKISSDASCYMGSYLSDMYITIGTDGATVWFMKDVEEIEDTYSEQGTLMMWSYGDESATRIASEVVNFSVTSGLDSGEINKSGFVFLKYTSVDPDENIFGNWMYFNGTEVTRFATDIIK